MLFGEVEDLYGVFEFNFFGLAAIKLWEGVCNGRVFPDLLQLAEDYLGLNFCGFLSEEIAAAADKKDDYDRRRPC